MASPTNPAFTMLVNGSAINMMAKRVQLRSLVPYSSRQVPTLTWSVVGGALDSLPDMFLSRLIELRADEGDGAYTIFKGTCEGISPVAFSPRVGWVRSFVAHGMQSHADRMVPVTSPLDGTDIITFNRRFDDRDFDPSFSGMSVGDMIRYVLESNAVAAALAGLGVGGYSSTGGSGAAATASIAAGHVTVSVTSAGSGYANPPNVILIGGGGTYTSCTVTISGGELTAVAVVGSANFTSPPEVWVSPLPVSTLRDLSNASMDVVPPYPVTIQGDGVLQAIEGCLRQNCPNHRLHVEHDTGAIRIYDIRDSYTSPFTLAVNPAVPGPIVVDVGRLSLSRSTEGCYGRVVYRGGPDVVAQLFSLKDETLERYYGHDGLDNDQAESAWKLADFTDPSTESPYTSGAATFTAQVSDGSVVQLSMSNAGSNYDPQTIYALAFSGGGGGTGAEGEFHTDDQGAAAVWRLTKGGSGYSSAPTVTAPSPKLSGGNVDVGTITNCSTIEVTVKSDDAARTWPADYWAWTPGNKHGTIYMRSTVVTGINQLYAARILGHSELTAGGTCVFRIDRTLPITTYSKYKVIGSAGGATDVYRRYRPKDVEVRKNLMTYFPFPQAMKSATGTSLAMTGYPTAQVVKEGGSITSMMVGMTTDVLGGSFLLDKPSVVPFSTPSKLREGGDAVDGKPDDVQIFGAVRVGNLQSVAPSSGYSGTGYAVEGFQRTLYVTAPDWIDRGNQANMDKLAREKLDSVKDVVVEGTIPLYGWSGQYVRYPNRSYVLSANYATYWDNISLPASECEVVFRSAESEVYGINLRVSNRRGAVNAAIYERPIPTGGFLSDVPEVVHGFAPVYGGGPIFTSPADLALDVVAGAYGQAQQAAAQPTALATDVAARMHATTPTPDEWLSAWSPAGAGSEFAAPPGPAPPQGGGGPARPTGGVAPADYRPWHDLLVRLGLRSPDGEGS